MFDDEVIVKIIDDLILEGGLEIAGIDPDTGEMLYKFTSKVKDLMPELYEEHMNMVNFEIMSLWEKGYVNIDLLAEDPGVSLTSKSLDQSEINKLSREERWSLEELLRIFDEEL